MASSFATEAITGNYTQNFNGIGTALPTNWTIYTGATATSLGSSAALTTAQTQWSTSTGQFANYASTTGLISTSTQAQQNASADRSLAMRQTGAFGDPGASFNFSFSTINAQVTQIQIDMEMLSVQTRSTTWSIQYGLGATPSSYVTLGTYADPATFGATAFTFTTADFSTNLDAQSQVWFRVVALSASTGGGSRDTVGIDNFSLNATYTPPPVTSLFWSGGSWSPSSPGTGGSGTWVQTSGGWDSTKTAQFGAAGSVTVDAAGVSADKGLIFDVDGYTVSGGAIALSGSNISVNTITTVTGTSTINAGLAGTTGLTKDGAGKLVLGGDNSGLSGGIALTAGVLAINSANALGNNELSLNGGTLTSADATNRTITNNVIYGGDVFLGEAGSGNLTFSGSTNLGGATRTLTINTALVKLDGAATNGGIIKGGTGTLQFASTGNSLAGLAISSGTAQINSGAQVAITSSGVTTSSGANLLISGTLLYQSSTSWVAPSGTVTLANGSTYIHNSNGGFASALGSANFVQQAGSTIIWRDAGTPSVSGRTYTSNLIFETGTTSWAVPAISGGGTWTMNGDLTIGPNVAFNYGTFSGTTNFNGNVTIATSGTLGAVNGARSFTIASGKTLTANGTLIFAGGQSLTIASGGTLKGDGTISGGIVNIAGTHAVGNSVDTQTLQNGVSYLAGSEFEWELTHNADTGPGTNFDQLIVSGGDINITDVSTLELVFNSAGSTVEWTDPFWDTDHTWTIVDMTGPGSLLGMFTLSASSTWFDFDGDLLSAIRATADFDVAAGGVGGQSVILTYTAVVPEPSTCVLLLGGLGMIGWATRRRRA